MRLRSRERNPEVRHAHTAIVADEDVVRLEVAVNDPHCVRCGEPAPRLEEDLEYGLPGARLGGEPLGERAPLDELHLDVDPPVEAPPRRER